MARNGSGTYSKVNTFVAGTSITAADHNENWDDLVAEVTNSVAVDGQSTMTGALKAASGTVAAPGIAFGSDPDSGLYRIGANNLGVAANGAKVLDIATTGLTVTGTLSASTSVDAGTVKQGGFQLIPAGIILNYGGSAAPDGWLLCYGQAISRTTYAALFTAISTTYGVGDGSTTFNVPDLRGRVIAGKDDMGGSAASRVTTSGSGVDGLTLGASGGGQNSSLATANLPAYTPAGSVTLSSSGGGAGTKFFRSASGVVVSASGDGGGADIDGVQAGTGTLETITASFTGTAQGGTSTTFTNMQPTIILNTIIKY